MLWRLSSVIGSPLWRSPLCPLSLIYSWFEWWIVCEITFWRNQSLTWTGQLEYWSESMLWWRHSLILDSIAISVFADIFFEFNKSEANPNNNLMMRRAGLSRYVIYAPLCSSFFFKLNFAQFLVWSGHPNKGWPFFPTLIKYLSILSGPSIIIGGNMLPDHPSTLLYYMSLYLGCKI